VVCEEDEPSPRTTLVFSPAVTTVVMDAQYPFASREDIWRVFEEVKGLYSTQLEHSERIMRLERRREDDMRMKSVWGPLSQFPSAISGSLTGELSVTKEILSTEY
jgi:hypothetical protein